MKWISAILVFVILIGGGIFYWQRLQSSKVIYVFLPEEPTASVNPWTAFTPADKTILYNTRRTLFKYDKQNSSYVAIPDLAETATTKDKIHWEITLKPEVTASQVIATWSETLKKGNPTVVGKLFFYIDGGQDYKNNTGAFSGLRAKSATVLDITTTFPMNLPMLLADPVFSTSVTTNMVYDKNTLSKGKTNIVFTNEKDKADIIWTEGDSLFSGEFNYVISSTFLPTSTSTRCFSVPIANLSNVETYTPTAFFVPPQKPAKGKASLYPWQLDYPDASAFRLGMAVLLNNPQIASSTLPLTTLMDKNLIYVSDMKCYSLAINSRISNLQTYLDIMDFSKISKKVL